METLIWVLFGWKLFDMIGVLYYLGAGKRLVMGSRDLAFSAFLQMCWLAWIAYVLL
jgi:hypothetical protein